MNERSFPNLGETFFEERLPCGLLLRVTPKPDFSKTYAFLAANYGAIDTRFYLNGRPRETPDGVATILSTRCSTCPRAM